MFKLKEGDWQTIETPYGPTDFREVWCSDKHVGWLTSGFFDALRRASTALNDADRLIHQLPNSKHTRELEISLNDVSSSIREAINDLTMESEDL